MGVDHGLCRGCKADIWWLRSRSGKPIPYNELGVPHFADCPVADRFRKKTS